MEVGPKFNVVSVHGCLMKQHLQKFNDVDWNLFPVEDSVVRIKADGSRHSKVNYKDLAIFLSGWSVGGLCMN